MQNKTKQHIFCVDDDSDMLRLIEMLLEDMGDFKVHHFTDAYSAFNAMRYTKPALVLLDIEMPDMNGLVAYQKMQMDERLKDLNVVFVTGRKRDIDLKQYQLLDVPTILKPFDPKQFQDLVRLAVTNPKRPRAVVKKQIFCIDDDHDTLDLIQNILVEEGTIRTYQYTDAISAFKALESNTPDLILLDIMMPEMDGITAYHKLRTMERLRDIPVVFVTARKRENDLAEYKKLGVPTITKPFDPREFKDLVGMIL